jgi:cell wall-associated NlpC family hydrolase
MPWSQKAGCFRRMRGVLSSLSLSIHSVRFSPETDGEGYVAADAVKVVKVSSDDAPSKKLPENEDPVGSEDQHVVKEARTYMGIPYRLGKASRSGVDCSGLTMLVYRRFGISLSHDVEEQYLYGSRVRGKPKAGGLVFYDEHGRGISHSGIATGRGTIIHASGYWNKVTETKSQYIRGYKGVKRLFK